MRLVVAVLVVAVGCSPPASAPPDTKLVGPPAVTWKVGDEKEFPIPPILDSTRASDRDLLDLANAELRVLADCMTRKGFRYWYLPHHSMPENPDRKFPEYGLWRLSDAERFPDGYGLNERGTKTALPEDENSRYAATLSAKEARAYNEALVGTAAHAKKVGDVTFNTDGCYHESRNRVYGSEDSVVGEVTGTVDMSNAIRRNVREHPAAVEAKGRWVACLRKDGYEVHGDQADPGDRTPAERKKMALKAARCDIEAGRWSVYSQLQKHYEEQTIKQNEAYFLREAEKRKKSVERAKAILGAPTP